ncbi:hypothetical protein BX600DRAFT_275346 [Xylariales sp. PMI_506]|nr:hypothetical protein BX600DRAFT_275346 [Xylariales sp. PMI_506]
MMPKMPMLSHIFVFKIAEGILFACFMLMQVIEAIYYYIFLMLFFTSYSCMLQRFLKLYTSGKPPK